MMPVAGGRLSDGADGLLRMLQSLGPNGEGFPLSAAIIPLAAELLAAKAVQFTTIAGVVHVAVFRGVEMPADGGGPSLSLMDSGHPARSGIATRRRGQLLSILARVGPIPRACLVKQMNLDHGDSQSTSYRTIQAALKDGAITIDLPLYGLIRIPQAETAHAN